MDAHAKGWKGNVISNSLMFSHGVFIQKALQKTSIFHTKYVCILHTKSAQSIIFNTQKYFAKLFYAERCTKHLLYQERTANCLFSLYYYIISLHYIIVIKKKLTKKSVESTNSTKHMGSVLMCSCCLASYSGHNEMATARVAVHNQSSVYIIRGLWVAVTFHYMHAQH